MDAESVRRRANLDSWQRQVTDAVVRNIIRVRDERRLNNDELRGRLALLDWDLTRDSLASILSGSSKRKVMPLGDVFLFAQALNVPPIALIFGTDNGEAVVSPKQFGEMHSIDAYLWFLGRNAPQSSPDTAAFREAVEPFALLENTIKQTIAVEQANSELIAYEQAFAATGIPSQYPRDDPDDLASSIRVLVLLRSQLQDRGIAAPPLPAYLAFVDEAESIDVSNLPITRGLPVTAQEWITKRTEQLAEELRADATEAASRDAFMQSDEYRRWMAESHREDSDESPS
jgi:hypothetical protein